jgi:hypothetical protein
MKHQEKELLHFFFYLYYKKENVRKQFLFAHIKLFRKIRKITSDEYLINSLLEICKLLSFFFWVLRKAKQI